MTDTITKKLLEKLRDHESADCVGDGGCYSGEIAGEAADKIEQYETIIMERIGAEHYGPYGTACQSTGQFDAGECWICYAKRKKAVAIAREREIDDLTVRAQILTQDAKKYREKANEMQLIAGRYQYQFEHAMKAINSIDDLFEYAYQNIRKKDLQRLVREALAKFTEAVKPKGK